MRHALLIAILAVPVLSGCPKTDSGKAKIDIPAEHVAAVNALIPPEWKDKVTFEVGTIVDTRGKSKDTYRLALPAGWTPRDGTLPGTMGPPDADDFGRSAALGAQAQIRVSFDCGGQCTSKDWAAEVDKSYYQKFTTATVGKVTKDDKRATGRTMVYERAANAGSADGEVNIITTWWKAGGSQHFICEAKLAGSAVALAPAFEKACALVSTE
jgi:hypothetical protein